MSAKEMAIKYYPTFWDIDRLKKLVIAKKLSNADYKEVTGLDFKE